MAGFWGSNGMPLARMLFAQQCLSLAIGQGVMFVSRNHLPDLRNDQYPWVKSACIFVKYTRA